MRAPHRVNEPCGRLAGETRQACGFVWPQSRSLPTQASDPGSSESQGKEREIEEEKGSSETRGLVFNACGGPATS